MRRLTTQDPAPLGAIAYVDGMLKIHRFERDNRIMVKAWRGRAKKPFAFFYFQDEGAREVWINRQIESETERQRFKAELRDRNKQRKAEMAENIQVGTILHYSWGYDQTNCDFFQVIEKKGYRVTLREIGSESVEGSDGFMSDRRRPAKDKFIGEPFKKMITAFGVSMDHGSASPCEEDADFYCSWYA